MAKHLIDNMALFKTMMTLIIDAPIKFAKVNDECEDIRISYNIIEILWIYD